MIVLRSEELLALVDPVHGAEILDLVHLPTGRMLLGRPPFAVQPPVGGDLPEDVCLRDLDAVPPDCVRVELDPEARCGRQADCTVDERRLW